MTPCFAFEMLHCSYHTIHTSGSDLFCSHKHFTSDERESETFDETSWPTRTRLVWLTFAGRFTFGMVVNRYTNLGAVCEACEVM
jgi:hypothetical protein